MNQQVNSPQPGADTRKKSAASGARFFPFAGDGKWYWQDADCDEAMGPFDSYRAAWRDYKDCRK